MKISAMIVPVVWRVGGGYVGLISAPFLHPAALIRGPVGGQDAVLVV